MRWLASAALAALAACGGSGAKQTEGPVADGSADTRKFKAEVDALAQPLVDNEWIEGAAIALIDGDRIEYYGYGTVGGTRPRTPDANTVFEIGSITKVFTGILLADAVGRGEVTLETPLAELAPEGVTVPSFEGKVITLEHLATHMSGLPAMPPDARLSADNPFADYPMERAWAALSRVELAHAPGTAYEYSNLGTGLLGDALARRAGMSFEELVRTRIAEPLRLKDTVIVLDADQSKRLAAGHDDEANPMRPWTFDAMAGAGALRSTVHDLAMFTIANFELADLELGLAIRLAQRPRAPVAALGGHVGLGWHIGASGTTLWHNGQTGGFHSFIALDYERRKGVVVLSNSATGTVDLLGSALALMITGQPYKLELPETVSVTEEQLERFVGSYKMNSTTLISVTRDDARLYAQMTGQRRYRVYPTSETRFYYRVVEATIEFEVVDGAVRALILRQGGTEQRGTRL